MNDTDAELIRTFITDENQALSDGRQGKFWTQNHYRIRPLVTKADGLLTPQERTDFYFHFMRASGVPLISETEIQLLRNAYRRMLPLLDRTDIRMIPRHNLLFIFGLDEAGILPSGETTSAKELKARLKLIAQVGSYTTQPAQRDKKAKFAPFVTDAVRILETLRHLGYRHDRRYGGDTYDVTNLTFWGMVLIGLLSEAVRADLVGDMIEGKYDLVRRDEQIGMLHRYVEAVLPEIAPDEERFRSLAMQLEAIVLERRNATESVALANELGLPFEATEDWEIYVSIPLREMKENAPIGNDLVRLQIRPDPDWQWELCVRISGYDEFSENDSKVFRNDLRLEPLGAGNLAAFPEWLKKARTESGLDFDTEAADIRVGRKRAAAKLVRQWLLG
ncbi:hypothetical protein O8B93_22125 [Agrobacterium rhizogenes]|uniref:hypothetical protein n=1 Tax=Rhizobium rhizogenes TaxID=359 RepID=UPI0022B61B59|nr:hypothetical protein [Rhizobium rhizogenes]MCZ7450285.1 hypothetical protein [Rhizobium rhizogenes]